MSKVKTRRVKVPTRLLIMASILFGFYFCLTSCNVTRKVTTESQYVQRGDTSCVIITKTIESYDASKKLY